MVGRAAKLLFILFVCFVFTFSYDQGLFDPAQIPRFTVLAFFNFILFGLVLLKKIELSQIPSYFKALLIGITLISIASISNSGQPYLGIILLIKLSTIFFFAYFVWSLLKSNILDEITIVRAISLFALVHICLTLPEIYSYYKTFNKWPYDVSSINGLMANKNLLASALLLSVPATIQGITKDRKVLMPGYFIIVIFSLIIIFLSGSKSSILSFAIFLILSMVFSLISFFQKKSSTKSILTITLGIFLLLFSGTLIYKSKVVMAEYNTLKKGYDHALEIFQKGKSYEHTESSIPSRFALYYATLEMISNAPFLGVGPGNWKTEFPCFGLKYFGGDVKDGITNYQRAHSDVLQFIAEFGLLNFFLIVISMLFLFKKIYHRKLGLLFAFLISYFVVTAFDFSFERPSHLLIYSLLIVLLIFNEKEEMHSFKLNVTQSIFGFGFLLVATTIFVLVYRGEAYSKKLTTSTYRQTLKNAEMANSWFYHIDPVGMPTEWHVGVAYFSQGKFESALSSFKKAQDYSPCNIHVLNNLASTFYELNNPDSAIYFYQEALQVSPLFDQSLINLSAVYFNNGQFDRAFETISRVKNSTNENYFPFLKVILKKHQEKFYTKLKLTDIELTNTFLECQIKSISYSDSLNKL